MVVGGREWWGREWGDGLLAHCGHHGRGEFVWVSLDLDLEDGNGVIGFFLWKWRNVLELRRELISRFCSLLQVQCQTDNNCFCFSHIILLLW